MTTPKSDSLQRHEVSGRQSLAVIRSLTPDDAQSIAEIYNHYVINTAVTFELEPVSIISVKEAIASAQFPWLGLEWIGGFAGYACANPWKSRCAYRYSVESTIYLHPDSLGKGLGTKLYRQLIEETRTFGLHSMIAGIALPNAASQRLHEKLGFKKVAHFQEVGWKFERWIDVGYWQLLL